MRRTYTLSLDPEVFAKAKVICGLVPMSRFVESLLLREIDKTFPTKSAPSCSQGMHELPPKGGGRLPPIVGRWENS